MALPHPLEWLPPERRKAACWTLLVLFLVLSWTLRSVGQPLVTDVAPMGIVSYEFVGSEAQAMQTHYSWRESGQLRAAFVLGLDYLYLLVYAFLLALLAQLVAAATADRFGGFAALSPWVAWGFLAAGLFDAIENAALTALLFGARGELAPEIAWVFAAAKFGFIGLGLVYLVVGAGLMLASRRA